MKLKQSVWNTGKFTIVSMVGITDIGCIGKILWKIVDLWYKIGKTNI